MEKDRPGLSYRYRTTTEVDGITKDKLMNTVCSLTDKCTLRSSLFSQGMILLEHGVRLSEVNYVLVGLVDYLKEC